MRGGGTLARAITQSSSLSTLKSIKALYGDKELDDIPRTGGDQGAGG